VSDYGPALHPSPASSDAAHWVLHSARLAGAGGGCYGSVSVRGRAGRTTPCTLIGRGKHCLPNFRFHVNRKDRASGQVPAAVMSGLKSGDKRGVDFNTLVTATANMPNGIKFLLKFSVLNSMVGIGQIL
jgi:hypothetical protein